jgi:CBS domain-containing protein
MALLGLWLGYIMLPLIPVFIYFAAAAEAANARRRSALEGLRIADLVPELQSSPVTITDEASLNQVLTRMRHTGRLELVVLDPDGAPLTVIRADDVAAVPPADRWNTRVSDLLPDIGPRHVVVPGSTGANDALDRAAEQDRAYIVVVDLDRSGADAHIGLVGSQQIQTALGLQLASGHQPMPGHRHLGGPMPHGKAR